MATVNPSTFVCFLVLGSNLLFCCRPAIGNNSTDEATDIIKGDAQSGSRTARQFLMIPAIVPYGTGLLTNYQQQQTPSNTFSQWFDDPSSGPTTNLDSSDMEFDDETLLSTRQQQQKYPCGRGPAALPQRQSVGIIGGSEAVKNSWPFIVALRFNGFVGCGGSLISPNKVLTAAHCVERLTSSEISQMTVSLGMHNVGDAKLGTVNDAQMTRRVSRVIMHNGYNINLAKSGTTNDIAILILESPVVYSDAISPVCLAPASTNPDQYADKDAAIIGWGRTATVPVVVRPDTLQQATVKITTNAKCKDFFNFATKNVICVFDWVKGLCQGDSGGPIIVRAANGAWTQVGIVSLGTPTCDFFALLTRVSAYRNWIDRNN